MDFKKAGPVFRSVTHEDVSQLISIYRSQFENADWVNSMLDVSLSRDGHIGIKATDENGRILAVQLATKGIYLTHTNRELYQKLAFNTIGLEIYTGAMAYVDESCRGHGLAGCMNREMKRLLHERRVDMLLCEMACDKNGGYPGEFSLKVFDQYIFLGEYEHYYREATKTGDRECLICGKLPCECSAKFYLFQC